LRALKEKIDVIRAPGVGKVFIGVNKAVSGLIKASTAEPKKKVMKVTKVQGYKA